MLARSAVKVKASADAAHFLHTNIAIQEGDITRGTAAAISETWHSDKGTSLLDVNTCYK